MVGLSVLSVEAGALITRARCVAATAEITEISRCAVLEQLAPAHAN